MKVLSCFDGMSCGQIALSRAGISIEKYYASEIDKYAIQVTQANYPDTIQLGSITEWQSWNIEKPDMIIGGSPCQGFSFAGKQLNFEDERSKLFFVFVDILKHYKPKYFLLENVVMKKEYNDVISSILGDIYPECVTQGELFRTGRLEPIQINSALVSAQNRNRLYWTNISGVTQPKDKGILLKDIIENGEVDRNKSCCLLAGYDGKFTPDRYLKKGIHQGIITGGAFRGRNISENKTEQKLEINETGKSHALTSVSKDSIVCYGENYIQYDVNKTGNNSQDSRIFYKDNKSNCLNVSHSSIPSLKEDETEKEIFWRKLTPLECERLQTVPDNYTNHVSNSQRYKMLGNGWTVDVIAHIFKYIQ